MAALLYLHVHENESTLLEIQTAPRPNYDVEGPMIDFLVSVSQRDSTRNSADSLSRLVHEFSDTDDIRTLFRTLTSAEDRKRVLGFESHHEMDERYPSQVSKVAYLKTLLRWTDGCAESGDDGSAITFDDSDNFIVGILWDEFWNGTVQEPERDPRDIYWPAVTKLTRLQSLSLKHLDLRIGYDDLAYLPPSLVVLDITGNSWTEASGDVDLSMLPQALKGFSADYCLGMTGSLKLAAPLSMLRSLDLMGNELEGITDLIPPPPCLTNIRLSIRPIDIPQSTLMFLKSQHIQLKLY